MYFIIYASSSTEPFTQDELVELLADYRENNTRQNITGMLLYKHGNFMQALEGDEQSVKTLFERIKTDSRHGGVLVFLQGNLEERQFPDWSMAFHNLNSPEVRSIPGYSEFLRSSLTGEEFFLDPTKCQKLLLTFRKNMR